MTHIGLHRRQANDRITTELCFYDILSVQLVLIKETLTEIDFVAKYEYLNAIFLKYLHYNVALFKDYHMCNNLLEEKKMFKYGGV